MKPKELPFFSTWEERAPRLHDGVFFVPRQYVGHQREYFPPFQSELVFGNDQDIHIEYCSGNGEWVVKKALENPNQNWIAVELQFDRVRKIWAKKKNFQLNNLLVVYGRAEDFTKYYLDADSIQGIAINFPDPWPKLRHAQNRLIREPFIQDLAKVSKEGAAFSVVTDDLPYVEMVLKEVLKSPFWKIGLDQPYCQLGPEEYGHSYFRRLWESKGKEIHYMKFIRGESL